MATTIIAPLLSIAVEGLKVGTIPIPIPLLPIAVLGLVPSLPILPPVLNISVESLIPRDAGPYGWQEDLVHFIGVEGGVTWNQSNDHAVSFETGRSFVPTAFISVTSLVPTLNLTFAPVTHISVQGITPLFIGAITKPDVFQISVSSIIPLILHRIDEPNIQPYGETLQNSNVQYYNNWTVAESYSLQWYGDGNVPLIESIQRYDDSLLSRHDNIQTYDIVIYPAVAIEMPYHILQSVNRLENVQSYALETYNTNVAENEQIYSLLTEDSDVQSYVITATVGTDEIGIVALNVFGSETSHALSFQMQVASAEDYNLCVSGSYITIVVNSTTFTLKVEGRSRRKEHGQTLYVINGLSKTCELDVPYADTITQTWSTSISAKTVVETLAAGFVVNWNVDDRTLKANTLFANDESPMSIIKRIVTMLGAAVTSTTDSELSIDSLYPIPVPDIATATPYTTVSDESDIISVDEIFDPRPGYNSVVVTDSNVLSADYVSIVEEAIDGTSKRIKVWHLLKEGGLPDAVELKTSGGNWVNIESLGLSEELLTETIEFISGLGSTGYPIFSYVAGTLEWKETSLGAITFSDDGALTAAIEGNSLLYIEYTTKYFEFIVSSPNIEDVQFYVE